MTLRFAWFTAVLSLLSLSAPAFAEGHPEYRNAFNHILFGWAQEKSQRFVSDLAAPVRCELLVGNDGQRELTTVTLIIPGEATTSFVITSDGADLSFGPEFDAQARVIHLRFSSEKDSRTLRIKRDPDVLRVRATHGDYASSECVVPR